MKANRLYILTIGLAIAIASSAEDLSKEITIEKEIVPQEREASRINTSPELQLSPIATKRLQWSNRPVNAQLTTMVTTLSPVSYKSTIEASPYRGYLDIGYFPSMDLGLSAGYLILNKEATQLNAWLQYNGSQYKRENIWGEKQDYKDHTATMGLTLNQQVGQSALLSAEIDYGFSSLEYPYTLELKQDQNINRLNGSIVWRHSPTSQLDYNIGVRGSYFGFNKSISTDNITDIEPISESQLSLDGTINYNIDNHSALGFETDVTLLDYSQPGEWSIQNSQNIHNTYFKWETVAADINYGSLNLNPYYYIKGDKASAKVGANITYSWGNEGKLRFAPNVTVDIKPISIFSIWATAKGGVYHNTLNRLFLQNHYLNPHAAFRSSNIPYAIDAGIILGPISGFSIELFGGYARANDWLMPDVIDYSHNSGFYQAIDIKGFHYGASLNYIWRDIITTRISYEGAPQEYDKGYFLWRDRAKSVINATVTVNPIKPLGITLAYQLRSDRVTYLANYNSESMTHEVVDLGDINSLNLSASYHISPAFSIFANIENLLNNDWQITYAVPNKGITGLVGITYKF